MKKLFKNKKGFTLVEMIVVIVIIAILVAIAVPSVMKYIDDANDATVLAQGRSAYIAAEAEIVKDASDGKIENVGADGKLNATILAEVNKATDEDPNVTSIIAYTDSDATTEFDGTDADASANDIKAYEISFDGKTVTIAKNGSSKVE